MVNYGAGLSGDKVVSTNETADDPILQYDNLTIEDGANFSVASPCILMVRDTLTVNGILEVIDGPVGGAGGNGTGYGGGGGDAGGSILIASKHVRGTGTIVCDGKDGGNGGATNNSNPGGNNGANGVAYSINGQIQGAVPQGGNSGRSNNNNNQSGNGGNSVNGLSEDLHLKSLIEDYLISGAYISESIYDIISAGSGAGGASGQTESNNGGSASAGGGGAGGSLLSKSGSAGDGVQVNNNPSSGGGGGGGGAGGFNAMITEDYQGNITVNANGGDGGDGGTPNDANLAGGGGGGGSGGFGIYYTNEKTVPDVNVDGGLGGSSNAANQSGTDGKSGSVLVYDINQLI
ncbi:hypothetical protein HSTV2_35 [Halorubrum sodomense tailed virus 2]|uniref:Uncharacterized protein n=1 Tax=Halorubrum sodomense tailed virus 2 TaxID=1262527 RepID=L7TGK9_9CAUD|nr:hypothetical protein HSTV2_35 [Halorubrum sodomense tailed virus 2]AGC34304.1 hypothetical protein HSTV2_35 [Halorubrum sodomense tailed virus 2]